MGTPVDDVRVLRAIAHPVRNQILGELDAVGSLRAADIAARLGIPANQASFHLRQLAKYGLVEEDPDAARDRRDRVWRVVDSGGLEVDTGRVGAAPGGAAAARVYLGAAATEAHRLVDLCYAPPTAAPQGIHRSSSDDRLLLSSQEARELREELTALVDRWRERGRSGASGPIGPGGGADERRTYILHSMLVPRPPVEAAEAAETDETDDGA